MDRPNKLLGLQQDMRNGENIKKMVVLLFVVIMILIVYFTYKSSAHYEDAHCGYICVSY